jgi:hypothetical protein
MFPQGPALHAGRGARSTLRIRKRICAGMPQSMPPALLAGKLYISIRSCCTCRPWCSQHLAHSRANVRRHDTKHAASLLAGNMYVSTRSCFTCRPWCSQHLAHSQANMRRHDSKHAASIAGWKHVGFHEVLRQCRPGCKLHLAHSSKTVRRHDAKHAASNNWSETRRFPAQQLAAAPRSKRISTSAPRCT